MAKTNRTDAHRPGSIVPAEYEYVMSYALSTEKFRGFGLDCRRERAVFEATAQDVLNGRPGNLVSEGTHDSGGRCCLQAMRDAGVPWAATGSTGKCTVCGAVYLYGDVWRHEPTGEHIHVGHQCADKYRLLVDRSAWELALDRAKHAAAVELTRTAKAAERAEFLSKHEGLAADLEVDHPIVRDIASKFVQYCSLSEKQVALVRKLAHEVRNPVVRAEEKHVAAPTGRVLVQGKIVSVKTVESEWGTTRKIVVKVETPEGSWLCYGSLPSSICDAAKGDVAEFTATLSPGRESHFAFASRPSKARIVSRAAGDEAAYSF